MTQVNKQVPLLTEAEIWHALRAEAQQAADAEPVLRDVLQAMVLDHGALPDALAHFLGKRLGAPDGGAESLREVCKAAFANDPGIFRNTIADINAAHRLDPACHTWLQPFLYYKGFAALQAHRVAHWLWGKERRMLALHLQSLASQIFQVDIHPAAQLGAGLFLDHGTGIVIGETCVVGADVTILQSVTLGGNGKERGDRHPKIGRGVLISVGAKVLGNIRIGDEARIAASSVVLQDVPPHVTVAGVPAKPVRCNAPDHPAEALEHNFPASS